MPPPSHSILDVIVAPSRHRAISRSRAGAVVLVVALAAIEPGRAVAHARQDAPPRLESPRLESPRLDPPRLDPLRPDPAREDPSRPTAVDSDVQWLVDVLSTSSALPAVRVGAAERLLMLRDSSGEPRGDALAALSAGLVGTDPAVAGVILDAMRQIEDVPAVLAAPLVELARSAPPEPPEMIERIRAAAARLASDAIPMLTAIVLDDAAELGSRRGAIVVLAAMRRQQSLAAMVELLAPDARTRRDLKALVCEMLERSFGQGFGDDPDRWIRWWIDNRFEAQSPAVQSLVQQLRERILTLEGQSTRSRREVEEVAGRLAAAYAEIFVALAPDLRMERVAKLMSDPLAAVREQCIGQVERMLANGESLTRPLTVALTERLSDPVPAHRIRAIKLLEGISRVESAPELAAAFQTETDPEVVAAYMRHFQRIPNPAVADHLVRLLEDPRFSVDAARSLVRLAEDRALDEASSARALDTARVLASAAGGGVVGANGSAGTPDVWFIRLLGVVGGESDLEEIERLLASSDPAIRGAAAETMRHRRRLDPLTPLASDVAIYPVLMRGLADPPVDLDRLRRVLELAPPAPAQLADRDAAVRRILATIDPARLIEADDLLLTAGGQFESVRRDALLRVAELPVDVLATDDRDRLLMRLARILCFGGEPARAATLLDPIVRPDDPELERLRFAAAVLDGRFDTAEQLHGTPGPWLDLLEEVNVKAPASAERVRVVIEARLAGAMSVGERARFETLSKRLISDGDAPPSAVASPPPATPTVVPAGPVGGGAAGAPSESPPDGRSRPGSNF